MSSLETGVSALPSGSITANNHTLGAGHLVALIIHGTHSRVTVNLPGCSADLCVCVCVIPSSVCI